ncbi:hypothetical protein B0H16DRAFT_1740220 [Mycena metata]|uniref:Protein kinase domain-containing protein n=1 Tax=Mycena metata TaxID=1033252 RepID=A0AAD7HD86_9AGAR|nr:hypothetical protein B0H16DRAFT_1740220 [Mycena metata]
MTGGRVPDILHYWLVRELEEPCTPHEFKREEVLRVDDKSVLDFPGRASSRPIRVHFPIHRRKTTIQPAFPTSVFQPYEGEFPGGGQGSTKLVSNSSGSLSPLPWARFDGDVQSTSNDVTIAYGRLNLLFLASRSLVAKTAHGISATQRLRREYSTYVLMRAFQGVAIPKMIGMFPTGDGKNTVLIMSHAGKALTTFSELVPRDKRILFHWLVLLHNTGVQHNDLEPRNVTVSSSGPVIIDFDRASLDHNCPGASCEELLEVAEALDVDPAVETIEEKEDETVTPTVTNVIMAIVSAVFFALLGYTPPWHF